MSIIKTKTDGNVKMSDINLALGLVYNTANSGLDARMDSLYVGIASAPYRFARCGGWNSLWLDWLEIKNCWYDSASGELDFEQYNNSTEDTHIGTLYWELWDGAVLKESGSIIKQSAAALSTSYPSVVIGTGYTPDLCKVKVQSTDGWHNLLPIT